VGVQSRADQEATFVAFVTSTEVPLLRLAFTLTGDLGIAQDLVQTALSRAYSHWPRIWDQDPLAYTRRIVVNANHDRWRRRVREVVGESSEPQAGPDHAAVVVERNAIVAALAELTPKERRTVVLRFLGDLSESETARELGVQPGTVKSTTHRAIGKLRSSGHLTDRAQEATP